MAKMTDEEQKVVIRAQLEERARAGETVAYGEIAKLAGLANQGLRPILQAIMDEEADQGRPDLGYLAVMKDTGWPSYVGG